MLLVSASERPEPRQHADFFTIHILEGNVDTALIRAQPS